MKIGIACASGSFKAVFVHGVLDAFERAGFRADVYAAASSSAVPAAFAAIGGINRTNGVDFERRMYSFYADRGFDIGRAVMDGIEVVAPTLEDELFRPTAARFCVAVSEVTTDEARELTQGEGARRLGQRLVLATRTRDRSWADRNLARALFDTRPQAGGSRLTPANLREVMYATTRMLHAWKAPAWIGGKAFVDASYTTLCPALELARLGCENVIAISPEAGPIFLDFFQSGVLQAAEGEARIHMIQPDRNLAELGVDYMKVTDEGLENAFALGREIGTSFLDQTELLERSDRQ